MEKNIIKFNVSLGRTKPENIVNKNNPCPFCQKETLTDIITVKEDFILLKNKYNVIENTEQFVLIECKDCSIDMPDYSIEYMENLIDFGIYHWFNFMSSSKFSSVAFFKNHGAMSGGTMRHAHMQYVCFKDIQNDSLFQYDDFDGILIDSKNGVSLNAATKPRLGFSEFNIIVKDNSQTKIIAKYIQIILKYFKYYLNRHNDSYNIFFYLQNNEIRIKLMPRFPTSPLFIGYDLRILPSNIESAIQVIKQKLL